MKDARMRNRKKHEERDFDVERGKGVLVDAARRKVVRGVTETIFRNVVAANPDRPTYDRTRPEAPRDYDAERSKGALVDARRRIVKKTTEAIFRNVIAKANRPDFATTGVPGATRAQRKKAPPVSPTFVGDVPNYREAYWPPVPDIGEVRSARKRGTPRPHDVKREETAAVKRVERAAVKKTVAKIFSNVLGAPKMQKAKARRPPHNNPPNKRSKGE
jgi:hypothetical protein